MKTKIFNRACWILKNELCHRDTVAPCECIPIYVFFFIEFWLWSLGVRWSVGRCHQPPEWKVIRWKYFILSFFSFFRCWYLDNGHTDLYTRTQTVLESTKFLIVPNKLIYNFYRRRITFSFDWCGRLCRRGFGSLYLSTYLCIAYRGGVKKWWNDFIETKENRRPTIHDEIETNLIYACINFDFVFLSFISSFSLRIHSVQ